MTGLQSRIKYEMVFEQKFDKSAFTISGCGSRGIVYRFTGVLAWLQAIFKTVPRS
jgi:hypothetical protein